MSFFGRLIGAVLAPEARPLPPMPLPPNRYDKKDEAKHFTKQFQQQRPQQRPQQHQHRPQPQAQQRRFEVRLDGKSGFAFETGEQGKAISFAKAQQVKATVFDRRDKRVVWVTLSATERARPKGQVARIKAERARLTMVSPVVVETGLTWSGLPTELLRTFGYKTQAQTAELHRRWQSSPLFRKLMEEAVVLWQWRGLMRRPDGTRTARPESHQWEGSRVMFSPNPQTLVKALLQPKPSKPVKVKPVKVKLLEAPKSVVEAVPLPAPESNVEPIVATPVAAPREKSPAEIEAEELAKLEAQIAAEEWAKRKKAEAEEKWLAEEIAKEEQAKRAKEPPKLDPRVQRRLDQQRSKQGQAAPKLEQAAPKLEQAAPKLEPVLPVKAEETKPEGGNSLLESKEEIPVVSKLEISPSIEVGNFPSEAKPEIPPVVEMGNFPSATTSEITPIVEVVAKKTSRRKAAEGVTGEVMRAWCKELDLSIVAGATLVGVSESTLRRMK